MKLSTGSPLALLVLSGLLASQDVLVVDAANGPGTDFTGVTPAVAAAADGDVILVRSGEYDEVVTIIDKPLTLQGDPAGGPPPEIGGLLIADLAAGETVTVRGFHIDYPSIAVAAAVDVLDSAGSVWLEELTSEMYYPVTEYGVRVEGCASVVFSGCRFEPFFRLETILPQVLFRQSAVHAFDSTFATPLAILTAGPVGIQAEGPAVLGIYGSTVRGGDADYADTGHGGCASFDGGDAILLVGDVDLFVQDADIQGGGNNPGCFPEGNLGEAIVAGTGPVTMLTSTERTHRASSPVRDDAAIDVALEGKGGDLVRVFFALAPRPPLTLGQVDGPILLASPFVTKVTLGTLPASGTQSFNVPIGDLGPGVVSIVLYTQALFIEAGTLELVLSEPTAVTLLDSSF